MSQQICNQIFVSIGSIIKFLKPLGISNSDFKVFCCKSLENQSNHIVGLFHTFKVNSSWRTTIFSKSTFNSGKSLPQNLQKFKAFPRNFSTKKSLILSNLMLRYFIESSITNSSVKFFKQFSKKNMQILSRSSLKILQKYFQYISEMLLPFF